MNTESPSETILFIPCTACGNVQETRLLMPIVTPQDRIMLLCGLCQWQMRPKESVSCEGVSE